MPNKPITVMYLIDTFVSPPGTPFKGGAEKQLYLLASSLNPEEFRSIIVQLTPNLAPAVPAGKRGNCEMFHSPVRKIHSLDGLRQICRLLFLAKRKKVDILHTFFEKSEVIGWLIRRSAEIPVWIISRRDLGFKRKNIYDWIFRLSRRSCTKCIANCQAVKEAVLEKGVFPEEKIEVIPNGVDSNFFEKDPKKPSLKEELGIRNGTPLIGMIANFNFEIKGHHYFLGAAQNILTTFPHTKFVLVGDGPLRRKYEAETRALGMENSILFLGKRNDISDVISSLDVSVLSSTSEGFSNVILESMAAGKPVVATDIGGNRELVKDGETGYLVPPGDPRGLADGILKLIQDPERAVSMGRRGKHFVRESFSAEKMVKSHEKLYNALFNDRT